MQRLWAILLVTALLGLVTTSGQLLAQTAGQSPTADGAATQTPRPLAPGVLKTIPGKLDPRDSYSLPMPLPGLNATKFEPVYTSQKDTLFGQSQRVVMFRDVWEYEFAFLGLRQARLLVPDLETGISQRKNVWYLIYRIRDRGATLTYEQVKQSPDFEHIKHDLKRDVKIPDEEKFFLPRFSLEGWVITEPNEGYQKVVYRNKVSPMVMRQVQRLEDPGLNLIDSIAMSKIDIPDAKNDADGGVWGVAVFEDVNPRLDYVSVFVSGLTNAFRISRDPDQPSRLKTLQLNFWRPGDTFQEENDLVEFGIPLVDNPKKQVLIAERYALPGPLLRGYHINKEAGNRNVLVMETDAGVGLDDFQSEIAAILDKGKLAPTVAQAFADSGITLNQQLALETIVPGQRWRFSEGGEEFYLALEPQFWEPFRQGIRFIKSLDHLWIYR